MGPLEVALGPSLYRMAWAGAASCEHGEVEEPAGPSFPSADEAWLRRQASGRLGFPAAWAGRDDVSLGPGAELAAVVHVFYRDLLDGIIEQLAAIPVPFDLIVTNASRIELYDVEAGRMPCLRRAVVLPVENRGRDLWPLAQLVNAGLLDSYGLIVKVHTKRSGWRESHVQLPGSGASWRTELLSAILGEPAELTRILDAYASSPDLGMVTADGSVLGPEFWGRNRPATATLLERLGKDSGSYGLVFAAGSMYWTRGRIMKPCDLSSCPALISRMSSVRSTAPRRTPWSESSG